MLTATAASIFESCLQKGLNHLSPLETLQISQHLRQFCIKCHCSQPAFSAEVNIPPDVPV